MKPERKQLLKKTKLSKAVKEINSLESVLKPSHCVKNDDVIEWEHEET